MKDDTCIPVKVSLQLMDTSSLGLARQYPSFRETHQDLQYALQAIVNGMASVGYGGVLSSNGPYRSPPRVQ